MSGFLQELMQGIDANANAFDQRFGIAPTRNEIAQMGEHYVAATLPANPHLENNGGFFAGLFETFKQTIDEHANRFDQSFGIVQAPTSNERAKVGERQITTNPQAIPTLQKTDGFYSGFVQEFMKSVNQHANRFDERFGVKKLPEPNMNLARVQAGIRDSFQGDQISRFEHDTVSGGSAPNADDNPRTTGNDRGNDWWDRQQEMGRTASQVVRDLVDAASKGFGAAAAGVSAANDVKAGGTAGMVSASAEAVTASGLAIDAAESLGSAAAGIAEINSQTWSDAVPGTPQCPG